ncbi:MAG: HEAT repeat domain-containing protein [Chloroflexi bacterium]|nr:HEAT repeat domain-containing protein [Chloroflexota bacterium]
MSTLEQLRVDLFDAERFMRMDAIQQIANIGHVPLLIEGFLHWDTFVQQVAADGLLDAGSDAVPALIPLLDHDTGKVRIEAVRLLGQIGDASALGPLAKRLYDKEHSVRLAAIDAIGEIQDPVGLALLKPLIATGDVETRQHFLEAVLAIGTRPVIEILDHILSSDPEAFIRQQAALGLAEFGRDARNTIPTLMQALNDAAGDVRSAATTALAEIGDPAILALVDALGGEHAKAAGRALTVIGEEALPELKAAFEDDDYGMAMAAAVVLSEMRALDILIGGLRSRNPITRHVAEAALENIPEARDALDEYRADGDSRSV